jgi:hypothetical protein
VGWACNLLTDLIGHWEKRHGRAMESDVRPTNLDRQMLEVPSTPEEETVATP